MMWAGVMESPMVAKLVVVMVVKMAARWADPSVALSVAPRAAM